VKQRDPHGDFASEASRAIVLFDVVRTLVFGTHILKVLNTFVEEGKLPTRKHQNGHLSEIEFGC